MTDTAPNDPVVVSADGVTVEKRFESEDFPVPTVLFDVRSEREVPVAVRLVDSAPPDIDTGDIGFHPEYGAECWNVEGEDVVFRREIEPETPYTTVYGLREGSIDDPGRLLTDPEIASVEPIKEGADPDDVTAAVSEIEDEAAPEIDLSDPSAESTNGSEDAIEPIDLGDPNEDSADAEPIDGLKPDAERTGLESTADELLNDESGSEEPEAGELAVSDPLNGDLSDTESTDDTVDSHVEGADTDATSSVEANPDETESAPTGIDNDPSGDPGVDSVASALAGEIRAGDVPEQDLETLRGALDLPTKGSVDARIQGVQARLADFDAYVDALEEFLDENGDTRTLLRDLKGDIEDVETRVGTLQAQIDSAVEEADERAEKLAAAVESEIDDMWEDLDVTRSALADLEAAHETLAADIEEIDADLDGIGEVEDDVEVVAAEVERLDAELSELAEMRERLGDVFGRIE